MEWCTKSVMGVLMCALRNDIIINLKTVFFNEKAVFIEVILTFLIEAKMSSFEFD